MIYGAIIGDIIGSRFEFKHNLNIHKNFTMFDSKCKVTDDSIMTIAVAKAMIDSIDIVDEDKIKDKLKYYVKLLGRKYPNAGYGSSFKNWLMSNNSMPYNSYGNGSAMRCSITGWLYNNLNTTRQRAKNTAEITHNHPEGIKGAEATASAIFLARNGFNKKEIKDYIQKEFNYNLNRTCNNIKITSNYSNSCQETVPEAIICFLESLSFEDTIRNCVYIGGDTDTLGAIAGSIAEAYYGIPQNIKNISNNYLDRYLLNLLFEIEYSMI